LESSLDINTILDGYQWLLDNDEKKETVYKSCERALNAISTKEDLIRGWSWLVSIGYPDAKNKLYSMAIEAIKGTEYYAAYEIFSSLKEYKDAPSKSLEAYRTYLSSITDMESQIKGYEWLLANGDIPTNVYESFSKVLLSISDLKSCLRGWQWLYSKNFENASKNLYSIAHEAWSSGDFSLAYIAYNSLSIGDEYKLKIADEMKVPVVFKLEGGEGLPESILVAYDKPIGFTITPHKIGYVFDGWYSESTLKKHWDLSLDVIKEHTTLFAKWRDYRVGEMGPAGGVIFYDKGNSNQGWRYLEAASSDVGKALFGYFRPDGIDTQEIGTKSKLGDGKNNTLAITSKMANTAYVGLSGTNTTNQYAANVCWEYSTETDETKYDDWFLPSLGELGILHENLKDALGMSGKYWSSTEYFDLNAWYYDFSNGEQNDINRSFLYKVRPIRTF
jgi:uncharacterized repeat protein (TIGR02543 family)